jgi:hypothetical protein
MSPSDLGAVGKPARPVRDQRLDMFRGLALVMIFVNHVPGTIYENYTSRNFGFSDAAEAFVLMSGMAAGLAYSTGFLGGPLWPAVARVWARARQLYLVHVTTTVMAIAIFAAGALWFNLPQLLTINNVGPLFGKPLSGVIGLVTMGHQLGYFNILPLYFTLLLATPLMLLIGTKQPLLLLGISVAVWALAGQFRINLPAFPNSGGWFFNPFSWQLIFVVGLLSGVAMRQGQAFVPFNRMLFWSTVAFALFILAWVKIEPLGAAGRNVLGWFSGLGLPFYVTWFDKTFLALPRLLHALALAYLVSSIPALRWFAESRHAAPLSVLGRHGLPVFAVGSVLSMLLQAVKAGIGSDPLTDGALLFLGLLALWLLATVLDLPGRGAQRISTRTLSTPALGGATIGER